MSSSVFSNSASLTSLFSNYSLKLGDSKLLSAIETFYNMFQKQFRVGDKWVAPSNGTNNATPLNYFIAAINAYMNANVDSFIKTTSSTGDVVGFKSFYSNFAKASNAKFDKAFQNFLSQNMQAIQNFSGQTDLKKNVFKLYFLILVLGACNSTQRAFDQRGQTAIQAFRDWKLQQFDPTTKQLQAHITKQNAIGIQNKAAIGLKQGAPVQVQKQKKQAFEDLKRKNESLLQMLQIKPKQKIKYRQAISALVQRQYKGIADGAQLKKRVLDRGDYYKEGKLTQYVPVAKDQRLKRSLRVFPQIKSNLQWQRKNLTYFKKSDLKDKSNPILQKWATQNKAQWNQANKRYNVTPWVKKNLMYKNDDQYQSALTKADQYGRKKVTEADALANYLPPMVKHIYTSDERFYRFGVGPAFGRRGNLYAGRYLDQVHGHLKTIPKPSLNFVNPLSYQQMDFYKKSMLLYYWNRYIDAQAQYTKWEKTTKQKYLDKSRMQFVKAYVAPQSNQSKIISFAIRIMKFMQTNEVFQQIAQTTFKKFPLFQKGIYYMDPNDLRTALTWAQKNYNHKAKIMATQPYIKHKNKAYYLITQLAKIDQLSADTWTDTVYNPTVTALRDSGISKRFLQQHQQAKWTKIYHYDQITKTKAPKIIKQYAGFLASLSQQGINQINLKKQEILELQADKRSALQAKWKASLLTPSQTVNKVYKNIFTNQSQFNTIKQQLGKYVPAGYKLTDQQSNQLGTRDFLYKQRRTRLGAGGYNQQDQ